MDVKQRKHKMDRTILSSSKSHPLRISNFSAGWARLPAELQDADGSDARPPTNSRLACVWLPIDSRAGMENMEPGDASCPG